MLHSLSRALHEEVQFDTEKVTSVDWASHPTLTHADTPETIDVVLVNGDPNPNRPDLPHYGAGETVLQAAARGGGQRRSSTRPACGCAACRSARRGCSRRWARPARTRSGEFGEKYEPHRYCRRHPRDRVHRASGRVGSIRRIVRCASKPFTAPRTSFGHPDLSGTWTNNNATPLQRPAQWADKEFLTDAELAAVQSTARQLEEDGDALFGDELILDAIAGHEESESHDTETGNYNGFWLPPRDFERRTSLIIDPPNGRIPPYTPEAQARRAAAAEQRRLNPADGPWSRAWANAASRSACRGSPRRTAACSRSCSRRTKWSSSWRRFTTLA